MSAQVTNGGGNTTKSPYKSSVTTNTSALTTVLSLSGVGRLAWLSSFANGSSLTLTIIVDGVSYSGTFSSSSEGWVFTAWNGMANMQLSSGNPIPINLSFSKSLVIQTSGSSNVTNFIYEM